MTQAATDEHAARGPLRWISDAWRSSAEQRPIAFKSVITSRRLLVYSEPLHGVDDHVAFRVLPRFGVGGSIVNRSSGRICDSFSDHQLYPNDLLK